MSMDQFAYLIPAEAFVFKMGPRWCFETPVGKSGIEHWLLDQGLSPEEVKTVLSERLYHRVMGSDILPGEPEIAEVEGVKYINVWVPPSLMAKEGEYPNIERILGRLTGDDEAGMEWLCHWLAFKIQNPALIPRVAVVFATVPGAGKGTLYRILQEMLGKDNCANIQKDALDSNFNSHWAQKLLVLADEVIGSEHANDTSQKLKIFIDSASITLEGKGKDQRIVKNRLAWIFASNDTISPINLEEGDRRYTVFSNHEPLDNDYKEFINGLFERDRDTLTPRFRREIQAFYYELLHLDVDFDLVKSPYKNKAKEAIVNASASTQDLFFEEMAARGLGPIIKKVGNYGDYQFMASPRTWLTPEGYADLDALYRVFTAYARCIGGRAIKQNRFLAALSNHRPAWSPHEVDGHTYYEVPGGKDVVLSR